MKQAYVVFESVVVILFCVLLYYIMPASNIVKILLLFPLPICLVYLEYKRTVSLNSPLLLWSICWVLVIAISTLRFSFYSFEETLGDRIIFAMIISVLIFFFSFLISGKLYYCNSNEKIIDEANKCGASFVKIVCYILTVAIICYFVNVIYLGYIPQFTDDVDKYRQYFIYTPFYHLIDCIRPVYIVIPICIIRSSKKERDKLMFLACFLFILEILTGWRTMGFYTIVMTAFGVFSIFDMKVMIQRKKIKKVVKYLVIVACFLISYVAITRAGITSIGRGIEYSIQTIWLYLAPQFYNMQVKMETLIPIGKPLYTTEALWGTIVDTGRFPLYENLYSGFGTFNVATYFLQPFADFGMLGIVIWTMIIAIIAGKLYYLLVKTGRIKYLILEGIFYQIIFTFYCGFYLVNTTVILWLIFGIVIDRLYYKYDVADKSSYILKDV